MIFFSLHYLLSFNQRTDFFFFDCVELQASPQCRHIGGIVGRRQLAASQLNPPHGFDSIAKKYNSPPERTKTNNMEEKTLDTIVVETRPTFVLDELRDIYYAQPRKKNPYMKPSIIRQGPKKKRNEACECGSGKKYKKCCAI